MTIKKSLISVAASAAIIAAVTGCSSDSTTAAATPAAASGTSTIQSAVQAVDGYIYNATAKAHYLAEDNATMKTVALTANKTTKDVVSNVVTLGSSTYSLPDANASIKSRIKFFSFVTTPSSTAGTVFTPAAYIEADGVDGYDANDTLLGATQIFAPGNSPIASPLTSMIVSAHPSIFGTYAATGGTAPTGAKVDLNATTFANIESNATAIATKLGLSGVNLLTADPIALSATNPTYKLVTALLKGAKGADATAILAAATPTNLAGILTTISTLPNAAGKNLAGVLATSAANGAFSTADIAGMNIEASVTAGTIKSLTPPSKTGKFALDGIEINSVAASTFAATGAKIDNSAMLVDFNMSNTDGNISNTAFKLVLAMSGSKEFVSQNDSNESGSIVVEVPFELNSTKKTANALAVPSIASTLVKWEAKASDGSQVVTKSDINATNLGIQSIFDTTTVANVLRVDAKTLINKIVEAADNNLTGVTNLTKTANFAEISNLQIALVDANGKIVGVTADGKNSNPIAKTSFSSMTGGITVSEGIKVINLGTTDLRATGINAANSAPVVASVVNKANNAGFRSSLDTNGTITATKNFTNAGLIVINKGAATQNLILTATTTANGGENNDTVTVSESASWITPVASSKVMGGLSGTATVDFNLTVDGNASITAEESKIVAFSAKDEFEKASTADVNVTMFFNLAPALVSGKTITDINDTNSSGLTYNGYLTNLNGATATSSSTCVMAETNNSTDGNTTCAFTADGNITITMTTDKNVTVMHKYTVTDAYGLTYDFNTTLTNDDE